MKYELLDGSTALNQLADEWDELWERSAAILPTARALPLQLWCTHFAPRQTLRAVLVRDAGRLVAALPLLIQGRFVRLAQLPTNDWMPGGTLLVDTEADSSRVADALLDGLRQLPCLGARLRNVPWHSAEWQALSSVAESRGWPQIGHRLHDVGLTDLQRTWEEIEAGFSGNHRRHMRKALRRAEKEGGGVSFEKHETFAPGELERLLRLGFEIETRGWKGREGTCVLQQPGMFEFVVRQAEELARLGAVRLVFLKFGETPIAFEYCWRIKGSLLTPKIGYDEQYSRLSPGQVLVYHNLQDLVQEHELKLVDYAGPLTDSTAKWCTGQYECGTLTFGQPSLVGRAFVYAYRQQRRWKERRAAARELPEGNATAATGTPVECVEEA